MRWLLLLLLLTACCPNVTFDNASFCIEIADDPKERMVGLMYVEHMSEDQGMFFIFPRELPLAFWMKNTLIPLDLIFLDKDLNVVDIKHDFQPCIEDPCLSYTTKNNAKYVLEINSGLAKQFKIKEGNKATLSK
jgi:hypothetical protein